MAYLSTFAILLLLSGTIYAFRIRKYHKPSESEEILRNLGTYFIVIDENLNVLRTNFYTRNHLPEDTSPKLVGDLLKCRNAIEAGGGNHEQCKVCRIRGAINRAMNTGRNFDNLHASMKLGGGVNPSPKTYLFPGLSFSAIPGAAPGWCSPFPTSPI